MMANVDWAMMLGATIDTLLMTGFSLLFTVIIGLPVGVLLFLTSPGQVIANRPVYQSVAFVVNVLRSVPFLILLIVMIPLSRVIVGTALGVQGSIPPLVASAAPFFARLVENVLRELDPGVSEACRAMGATSRQTVLLALLPEATTGILAATVVTGIALVGYSAMSGVIGGGGLGDLAVRYGYQRYQADVMAVTVVILVVMVQVFQGVGDRWVAKLNRR
ncbi:methionine ABC transporter permease [Castellaniella sp. UC4442_H9]|jgi:D-methionine transport system permease protein|nr:methionine ABC transporter permease [Castellaniella sp.]